MSVLREQIKKYLEENRMSVNQLARDANLPASSLKNIMQGRVTNPSAKTITALVKALQIPYNQLFCEPAVANNNKIPKFLRTKNENIQPELFNIACDAIARHYTENPKKITKIEFIEYVNKVYDYLLTLDKANKRTELDDIFVNWMLESDIL